MAAGCVVHQRLPPPHQAVEQRALAHVGPPDDGHLGWRVAGRVRCAVGAIAAPVRSEQRQAAGRRRRRRQQRPRPSSPRAAGCLAARWHSCETTGRPRPPAQAASAVAYGPARRAVWGGPPVADSMIGWYECRISAWLAEWLPRQSCGRRRGGRLPKAHAWGPAGTPELPP